MGRWMTAVNSNDGVIYEMTPNFLIYCNKYLPKPLKKELALLTGLDLLSEEWIDEKQTFTTLKIKMLKNELLKLSKILNKEIFVTNINVDLILKYWVSNEYNLEDINTDIFELTSFFEKALKEKLEIKIYL
jgi:hypothetical protein